MAAHGETPSFQVRIRRIYEPPDGGFRVLVDRLWPRGVSKEKADLDEWAKELAPSSDLRTWFGHREERWPEFVQRYRAELADNPDAADFGLECRARPDTVLLYGARNPEENEAVVLRDYLLSAPAPGA